MSMCCLSQKSSSWASQPKKLNYRHDTSACAMCPWYQMPALLLFGRPLLFCRAPTSCLLSCWLLYLEEEKGDVSSLGMGQQHWFDSVFLSYLFIRLLVLRVAFRISDSHLGIYSNYGFNIKLCI